MKEYEKTSRALALELGDRLKVARLNADFTQKQLAEKAGVSLKAVVNSENGKSTLESFVAILMALELTEQLNSFLPKQDISPIQLAKLRGKTRKRATGSSHTVDQKDESYTW
ncbi:helix-turn-helix transcriptional regulator [Paraglaciecola sp.]|uniref:helix-turn-helix transcriptional regulator n=1 Tax=Paraglaciecola sp. TaxID=1920173 RepID=UPI003EF6F593